MPIERPNVGNIQTSLSQNPSYKHHPDPLYREEKAPDITTRGLAELYFRKVTSPEPPLLTPILPCHSSPTIPGQSLKQLV